MCDKEALEPASRVFKTKIIANRTKRIQYRPDLFPPDGKGYWKVTTQGERAKRVVQRLNPLLTSDFRKRWRQVLRKCR